MYSGNAAVLGYALTNDDKSHWYTDNGGEYLAVGVGGTVRGFRADLIVIDDPVKDREAADSETARANLWEYYHSDLLSRLKPDGANELFSANMLLPRSASWYSKSLPTFSDALAAVRRELWAGRGLRMSSQILDVAKLSGANINSLINVACYAN
jgi:hypothetical protein